MSSKARFPAGWRQGAAVAAVCAMLGFAASASFLLAERQRLLAEAGEQLQTYAGVMATRLDSSLSQWAHDVRLLTRFETFEREPPEPRAARRLLEDLQTRSPTFSWIGFAGGDGRVIAATGGLLEGADVSARPWFAPGLNGLHLGDVHPAVLLAKLLPVERGGGEGAYFVDAAAPVHSPDGRVLGVIAGHLTWRWVESVRDELVSVAPRHPVPVLRVLAADGAVLLGPERGSGQRLAGLQPEPGRGWREETLPGQDPTLLGFGKAEGVPGQPSLGWVVVAEADRATVLAGLWPLGLFLGFGTMAIAGLGGLLATWNANRMGSAVRRLIGAGQGDLTARIEWLRDQAFRDPLTGLLNRAGFEAWQKAEPALASSCAVVALDLDGFKPINDRYGHAAGDDVLRGIGAWFRDNLRDADVAVRMGGDEFILCLPGPQDKVATAAREVSTRLDAMLRAGVETASGPLALGCSAGVALIPQEAATMVDAIALADAALYEVKRSKPKRSVADGGAQVGIAIRSNAA
ncbi:diguanylate cyclase [Roseomonas sp. SSH11]|uniref:diguanylate cyclase n=1 Tax=Pararoseomonas baculiformis TaxID=2820812 RepID=A0ABS4ADB2_9PROT|nr:diguanylate cyclase [Pararoseomonas baculiformis]MBP0444994.1 diguanylate cyclase [Pararoseomonas baculiformis]